ncbi:hypothetical protein FACS1894199_06130 [Bacteroidia bacterium]|nr:hypothetical protein FACS1894199_06130 [Bacteroidia bacterium]
MRGIIIVLISILLCSCGREAKEHNDRGMEYMKQGLYDRAIEELNAAIILRNGWTPPYYNRAICLANVHRYLEALNDFNFVEQNDPYNVRVYLYRGVVYENMNSYASAVADYTRAIDVDPEFLQAYHYRGIARFYMKDYEGALTDYFYARKMGLNETSLYYNIGVVMQEKGDLAAAIENYSAAIAMNPSYANAYYNRGIARFAQSRSNAEAAIQDLRTARKLGITKSNNLIRTYAQFLDLYPLLK